MASNENVPVREFCANGSCMNTKEVEAKLDEGNIQDAETALQEGLSLSSEEARALLGKFEYQRGNVEGALRVFEGIDLTEAIQRLQTTLSEKPPIKKGSSRAESPSSVSQHAASMVLEAIYLKAKSLQKLGKFNEAANECKEVLDAVEKIFGQGIPDTQVDNRLQEIVSCAVELLPELWKQAGCYHEAITAYRHALLSQWNLDNDCCARIQKAFAVFLLYSGVEASPPSFSVQIEGSFVPKNNLEEAILLLMILLRKFSLGKIKWDPSIMEHLTFALSACGETSILAKQYEDLMPGVYHRIDRWNSLALCFSADGQNKSALNLLRKSLHKHERPNDVISLLLAARICSEGSHLAAEGAGYAQRAIENARGLNEHLKGVGLRMLGLCLGKQAKVAASDFERSMLQSKALQSLEEALRLEQNNFDLIFELAIQYAVHRNLAVALRYAKEFFDKTGGSKLKGWRLLSLVLSAQKRFSEAEMVTDAAIDETAKWEQGPLLRLKAKLKIAELRPMDAIEIYRYLLALVQAQKKSAGAQKLSSQDAEDQINEFDVWHGLANLYVSLSHWKDAEICLQKARELKQYSAATIQTEGVVFDGRGQYNEALAAAANSVPIEPNHVPSKILMASLILKNGSKALPVCRSLLSDALRVEPTNRSAWYYLGLTHRDDGRIGDAADCFQAASMLEESDPVESFSSML
ncbi:protein NPG1-like [Vicia villosa]|uniref:protein NPG1-like n=1 Tax=Vicia villosa TaxID=3911 RepID=UPI00273AE142|nr:protein NPG1-like [Vicia villosa]